MKFVRTCLIAAALSCGLLGPAVAKPASPAPATVTLPSCAWDRPGHNPFMSDVVAAVDDYHDLAPEVRARLKQRMARHEYDDIVRIRRDRITGRATYGAAISDMHFGVHQMCRTVTRAAWSERMQERGLVYCEGRQCILVPTVCRNVSRITRAAVGPDHAEAADDPADKGSAAPAEVAFADPAPPPTPLATDAAPSFAAPLESGHPEGSGAAPGGSFWGSGPAGTPPWLSGPRPGPSPGPTVFTTSVPPVIADGPVPLHATPPVPEPQTWALLLAGLAALAAWRRRRLNP